jgi:hypothetical protein
MKTHDDQAGGRIEPLLRCWGRDEALSRATPPPAPPMSAIRQHSLPRFLGYLAAAAAGFLLALGVWAALGKGDGTQAAPSGAPVRHESFVRTKTDSDKTGLKVDLAVVEQQREYYGKQLADLRAELQDALKGQARQRLQDHDRADKAERQLEEARAGLKELALANRKLTDQLGELETEVERARLRHQEHLEKLARAKQREEELRRLGGRQQDHAGERARLREQTGRLQRQLDAQRDRMQRRQADLYLELTVGGDRRNMAAWQRAARQRKLLARCGEVRHAVDDPAAREVLDAVETLLTRLDMIDVDDARAAGALAKLVRDGGVVGRLENIDRNLWTTDALLTWAAEVAVVLRGVSHAA